MGYPSVVPRSSSGVPLRALSGRTRRLAQRNKVDPFPSFSGNRWFPVCRGPSEGRTTVGPDPTRHGRTSTGGGGVSEEGSRDRKTVYRTGLRPLLYVSRRKCHLSHYGGRSGVDVTLEIRPVPWSLRLVDSCSDRDSSFSVRSDPLVRGPTGPNHPGPYSPSVDETVGTTHDIPLPPFPQGEPFFRPQEPPVRGEEDRFEAPRGSGPSNPLCPRPPARLLSFSVPFVVFEW